MNPAPIIVARPHAAPARRPAAAAARTGWDLPLARPRTPEETAAFPRATATDPSGVDLTHPAVREHLAAQLSADGHHPDDYLPDAPAVPDGGGWLAVLDTCSLDRYADQLLGGWRVPRFSLWWGDPLPTTDVRTPTATVVLPYTETRTAARDAAMTVTLAARLVRVLTPGGTAWLWPRETAALDRDAVAAQIGTAGSDVHPLPGSGSPLGIDPEHLFYLRSRGIGYRQAIRLLLHEVRCGGVAYVTAGLSGPPGAAPSRVPVARRSRP